MSTEGKTDRKRGRQGCIGKPGGGGLNRREDSPAEEQLSRSLDHQAAPDRHSANNKQQQVLEKLTWSFWKTIRVVWEQFSTSLLKEETSEGRCRLLVSQSK